jgi:transposase-like protein
MACARPPWSTRRRAGLTPQEIAAQLRMSLPLVMRCYTYVALSASSRAIVSYLTGKRTTENTDTFIQDIRQRVIGTPEISTDGYHPYKSAIRDAFGNRVAHGTIVKTYSVTHLAVTEASRRYSPAQVVAVARDVVSGVVTGAIG